MGRTDPVRAMADRQAKAVPPAAGRLPRAAYTLVYLLFFLSGITALAYEVVWMRMLSFVFGNTTYAVSVVLAVFLGGLALGAMRYGRRADRSASGELRLYGYLEAAAALLAMVLPVLLLQVYRPLYTWSYRWAGENLPFLTVVRLALSVLTLLPPALLLGGTFPVLSRFVGRQGQALEPHLGRLYGVNTLGAVGGAFLAGFVLLPDLGLAWANRAAACGGLAIGITALLLGRAGWATAQHAAPEAQPLPALPRTGGRWLVWLLVAFALSGFAALAYEALWTRLLVFLFESTVYAFSTMLCVYLLGLALGSLLYSLLLARSSRQVQWLIILEVLTGLLAAATPFVFLHVPRLEQTVVRLGLWREVTWIFVVAALVMLPATLLIGAIFPLVCGLWAKETKRVGTAVGEAYLVNTVGTVAGSLAAGFVLIPALGTARSLFAMGMLNIFAGALIFAALGAGPVRVGARLLVSAAALLALFLGFSRTVTARDLVVAGRGLTPAYVEWVHEGIDSTVTIEKHDTSDPALAGPGPARVIAVNGINVAGTSFDLQTTQRLQAHIAMLLHPHPRQVMHIGFGSGGTAHSLSLYPELERVDCVEISKAVIQAAPHIAETNRGVLSDPRFHVYLEDARTFVRHAPRAYDLLLSDLAHPTLAGEGFFFSVDYLRDCARRLAPGGIFSTWAPLHGVSLASFEVMLRSIRAVFPYVYIWHSAGGRNAFCIVQASLTPMHADHTRFSREMTSPAIADDLAWVGLSKVEELLALRLCGPEAVTRWVGDYGQVATDDNGYLEFRSTREAALPAPRRLKLLELYPEFARRAGGTAADFVVNAPANDRWRKELRRQEEANRQVLRGRLYELSRTDRDDLRAVAAYRRALALVPDHFVARSLLGITPRHLRYAQAKAAAPGASSRARSRWVATLAAAGHFAQAQREAERAGDGLPAGYSAAAVLAVLQGKPAEVRREVGLAAGRERSQAFPSGPVTEAGLRAAAVQEQAAPTPIALAAAYGALGETLSRVTFRDPETTQLDIREGDATVWVLAAADLLARAAATYEHVLQDNPQEMDAWYGLARARGFLGDYPGVAAALAHVTAPPTSWDGVPVTLEDVQVIRQTSQRISRGEFDFLRTLRTHLITELPRTPFGR